MTNAWSRWTRDKRATPIIYENGGSWANYEGMAGQGAGA